MMSTGGDSNPSARIKITWGVLIAGIATSLLLAGGIDALQTATIVFALPFTLVVALMAISLWRAVREDWKEEQRIEKDLRQRMRQLVSK